MLKAILIGILVWLLLTALTLTFMAGASILNERYDRTEDKKNENYSEGE